MEPSMSNTLEAKYQKLAAEYSKIRGQANVLKKAVLEEQRKNCSLKDVLRQKETALRRAEQEVDSLGFRNKQLEHRVASLQDDIDIESKKSSKSQKISKLKSNQIGNESNLPQNSSNVADQLVFEELQKKTVENAQLTLMIEEKDRENQMLANRIKDLEINLEKCVTENSDLEKVLRRDLDALASKNLELEAKLDEAGSMISSEDDLSVPGIDLTNTANSSTDERIKLLEKEAMHWRTQYEILKVNNSFPHDTSTLSTKDKSLSKPASTFSNSTSSSATITSDEDQVLFDSFNRKLEDALKAKFLAESRLVSHLTEGEHLQHCLESVKDNMKQKEIELEKAKRSISTLEDDLATTRLNYEEQISVLTEQVISLSEQLASCS